MKLSLKEIRTRANVIELMNQSAPGWEYEPNNGWCAVAVLLFSAAVIGSADPFQGNESVQEAGREAIVAPLPARRASEVEASSNVLRLELCRWRSPATKRILEFEAPRFR